eukprot:PhM_4_TR8344/c1_g1_i6/m.17844
MSPTDSPTASFASTASPTIHPTKGISTEANLFELYDAVTSEVVTSMPSTGVLMAMSSSSRIVAEHTKKNNANTPKNSHHHISTRGIENGTASADHVCQVSPPQQFLPDKPQHQKQCAAVISAEAPDVSLPLQLYKTALCTEYTTAGVCSKSWRCSYAHGAHEIRTREI